MAQIARLRKNKFVIFLVGQIFHCLSWYNLCYHYYHICRSAHKLKVRS